VDGIRFSTFLHNFINVYLARFLLTNSTDRVIRHFEIPAYPPPSAESEAASEYVEQDIEPVYKFADPVDKVQWNGIGYSADTEWVIGGENID
jgi:COMPASS component SWD1